MPNGGRTVRVDRLWYGFANAAERWLARVERAADEGNAGTYSPQNWLSDVVASWSDAVETWALPYKVCNDRMRIVVFKITQTTREITQSILIPDPGPGVLELDDDFKDASGNVRIPRANVQILTADNRRTLVVRLFNLNALPPIPVDTYQRTVRVQGTTTQIALVRVIVTA